MASVGKGGGGGGLDVKPWILTLSCEPERFHLKLNILGQSSVKGDESGRGSRKGEKGKDWWQCEQKATAMVQVCNNKGKNAKNSRDAGKEKLMGLNDQGDVHRLASHQRSDS